MFSQETKMETLYKFLLFCCCIFLGSCYNERRNERMFSLFNVVKFKNSGCQSTSSVDLQGVCYTSQECQDKGGTSDGNCAASFGVCCIISISGTDATCTGTVTQNCSYIENPNFPAARTMAGTCTYMVNRCSSDICQIRLDFLPTVLNQPNAIATTTNTGTCGGGTTDSLTLLPGAGNVAANNIPVLCGTLSNQHVYLEASRTADLAATLTMVTVAAAGGTTRNWRIKVSQIECHSRTRAPDGCLQYFTGARNTVTSFNFDGTNNYMTGGEIANQDYRVCFRQEAGMCGQQFSESVLTTGNAFELATSILAAGASPETVSGSNTATCAVDNGANMACLMTAANTCSFIEIPGGSINPPTANSRGDIFCGQFLNPTNGVGNAAAVTTFTRPFTLRHVVLGNTQFPVQAGYSLDVSQIPC